MTALPSDTERLRFALWTDADLAQAAALWGDPEVTRWIARARLSEDEVRAKLAAEIACQAEHGVSYWPIYLHTGDHVGCAGLRPYRDIYELGFHLRRAHWGRGLASEAARAVIAHAFDRLGARALFAGHHPRNTASAALLGRLGFRYVRDELYSATGLWHPSYLLDPA